MANFATFGLSSFSIQRAAVINLIYSCIKIEEKTFSSSVGASILHSLLLHVWVDISAQLIYCQCKRIY